MAEDLNLDLLVKLYDLPELDPVLTAQKDQGIEIRRGIPPEKHVIVNWVRDNCNMRYASECEMAFSHHPVSCYIVVDNGQLVGFACYEATCKDFFGPMEVLSSAQGRGVGKALLLACLYDMAAQGYAYAIIGRAGPFEFYRKTVGAIIIEGSEPGIYRGRLAD
jgi:GNAT superfamily N-acetyltransferase